MIRKNMRRPLPGDIIVADRKYYKHYGIYIGSNQVIHFGAEKGHELNPSRAKVIKTSLKKFQKGDPLWVEESDEYNAFDSDKVIALAKARLGKRGYNILTNNCEHFANECKYGVKRSRQVEIVIKEAGRVASIAIIVFASGSPLGRILVYRNLYKAVA
ncbi:MAG: lecithin retinol acyltransferase family protein [Spirochaetia bacterium]|nr:lecithin retinol acyltransferase family protein [Ruminococcus sp.]MBR4376889.1 lecithin retinol acyltransferase family protein [Spirochaetia bacterium]MBR5016196.1 lecithin retinol acyltransferase family protein [Spirochaetia bacterium]